MAGEYKVKLNEDILTAMFLQYIGVYWAVYFKEKFLDMYDGKLWENRELISYGTFDYIRREFHRSAFLTMLPNSMSSQDNTQLDEYVKIVSDIESQDELKQDEDVSQTVSFEHSANSKAFIVESDGMEENLKSTTEMPLPVPGIEIDFKQNFLHVLSTEIRLNQVIHPNLTMTVVQTEFETLTSSIRHEPILATMEFLGVSESWLNFFRKFLKPKVIFPGDRTVYEVRRGTPSDHVLSQLFSECLLFIMEFQLNSRVQKVQLYRISDEFWYWNQNTTHVLLAWKIINKFADFVGLKLNENRSGSLSVDSDEKLSKLGQIDTQISKMMGPKPLPQRGIHWGYLNLFSDGTFRIDQNSTENFIAELKEHLNKADSVLDWILAYNKYLSFFKQNFGKSALVLGTQHQDQIIGSLKKLHDDVFDVLQTSKSDPNLGNPLCALKTKFTSLSDLDVIDVWVYWTLEKGGLGLKNPFLSIMLLRDTYQIRNDTALFRNLPLQDKIEWENLKKIHDEDLKKPSNENQYEESGAYPYPVKLFDTWEEYIAKRESHLTYWGDRYNELLEVLQPISPTVSEIYPLSL